MIGGIFKAMLTQKEDFLMAKIKQPTDKALEENSHGWFKTWYQGISSDKSSKGFVGKEYQTVFEGVK